ncbi:alpha-galactosidase A [Metarhizium anisopliae]
MAFRMLSMDFDTLGTSNSYFRILANTLVKYVVIAPGAMDAESLDDMPLNFLNILPPLAYDDDGWTTAYISRDSSSGELVTSLSASQLNGVTDHWHPKIIDFRQLQLLKPLTALVDECEWATLEPNPHGQNTTMIAKMARFNWEVAYIERETRIYALLEGTGIAPRFLGHIHEQGRTMGLLLEKVAGRHAGIDDLSICAAALGRLHALGISHGDCNRYNFIVGVDDKVTLIDFEHCIVAASKEAMQADMDSLPDQLTEESGRGGGFRTVLDDEV